MNKKIPINSFAERFKDSEISSSNKMSTLAKSAMFAVGLATASVSLNANGANSVDFEEFQRAQSFYTQTQNKLQQELNNKLMSGDRDLSFENFLLISKSKRSGVYEHPYHEGEYLTLFMPGDNKPIENITSDWELIHGGSLPPKLSERLEIYKSASENFDGSEVLNKKNLSHYITDPFNSDVNFVYMDTIHSMMKENSQFDNEFFYFGLLHEAGHGSSLQKNSIMGHFASILIGGKPIELRENSADAMSMIKTSQEITNFNENPQETVRFLNEIKDFRKSWNDKLARRNSTNNYFGQLGADLVIDMMKENPERLMSLSNEEILKIGKEVEIATKNYDFKDDFFNSIDLKTGEGRLAKQNFTSLTAAANTDREAFENTLEELKSKTPIIGVGAIVHYISSPDKLKNLNNEDELDNLMKDLLAKNLFGDADELKILGNEKASYMISMIGESKGFNDSVLTKLESDGLWERGAPLEPEFQMDRQELSIGDIDNKLNTMSLQKVMSSAEQIESISWEQGRFKSPSFNNVAPASLISIAEKYGFDINIDEDGNRVDLLFKDKENTAVSLFLNDQFDSKDIQELEGERLNNLKSLEINDPGQLSGNELKPGYSALSEHEIAIRDISYALSFDERNTRNDDISNNEGRTELSRPATPPPRPNWN